jgi:phytanoyl-CoA dioxygenase PhyH
MRDAASLATALEEDPSVPDGLAFVHYSSKLSDLRAHVAQGLVDRGICSEPLPLETLHLRIAPDQQQPGQGLIGAPTIQSEPALRDAYHALVGWLARHVLKFDVVFEANPPIRFHWPIPMPDRFRSPDGTLLCHHSDIMGGDPLEQVNGWLPLTDCRSTNALQYVPFSRSLELLRRFAATLSFDFDELAQSRTRFYEELCADPGFRDDLLASSMPLEIDYGTVAIFDARVIHGTAENNELTTRVSIDFRLLPVHVYDGLAKKWAAGDKSPNSRWQEPLKGGFYDESSAYEVGQPRRASG